MLDPAQIPQERKAPSPGHPLEPVNARAGLEGVSVGVGAR